MRAFRKAVTACTVTGAGLVLAVVTAGSALAAGTAGVAAPAQAATAASAARTAAPAATSGAGLVAAASHRTPGKGSKPGKGSGSGQACTTTYEFPIGVYEKCFRIEGQGLHIEKATAWVDNKGLDFLDKAHFEIVGPSGHILNCDDFLNLYPGHRSPDCSWEPHADVPAGRYCAKLWMFFRGGWEQVGISTCIDVHA